MVDLLLRALNAMGEPIDDVAGMAWEDFSDVIEPWLHVALLRDNCRRPIQVEHSASQPLDPAAFSDQLILDFRRLPGRPGHLFDRAICVEPRACREFFN